MALRAIVIYFSRAGVTSAIYWERTPGNTRIAANFVSEMAHCDTFEIVAEETYSENYMAAIWRAGKEMLGDKRPAIKNTNFPDLTQYDLIFFGYPIWAGTFPMIFRTFIDHYDPSIWNGKRIAPFCTHGGGGKAKSAEKLAALLPGSTFYDCLSLHGRKLDESRDEVAKWLATIGI